MKKKIISVAAAAAMALSQLVSVSAASFPDVSGEYEWAKTYIDDMADAGIINGYDDGTFRPGNDVTRLEVLALFARAMGSTEDVNEPITEWATEKYADKISACALPWGNEDIAYLMAKGVLKDEDLNTYLAGSKKNEAMPRHEAAVIITKAMYGEKDAKADTAVSLDYSDTKDIPQSSLQYVSYASKQGIMTGMEDNTFSPLTGVNRAQMAVMLSRTVDKTKYVYKEAKLVKVDADNENIVYLDGDDEIEKAYTDSTSMTIKGEQTQPKFMPENVKSVLSFSNGALMTVDALSAESDREISGTYIGFTSSGGSVTSVTIQPLNGGEQETIQCADKVTITYNGESATMASFNKNGEIMTLTIEGGLITAISGEKKTSTITGAVLEEISQDPFEITIAHSSSEYDGKTYPVSTTVDVTKNGNDVNFQSIYEGDKVDLTLEYGVVTKLVATSSRSAKQGVIKSITISNQSSMIVSINGEEKSYDIPNTAEITINGNAGTLYDFRVGDDITVTLESNAIVAISAVSVQTTEGSITGTVTAVNPAFGFIKVEYTDGGTVKTENVYVVKNKSKIMNAKTTHEIDIEDVTTGSTVNCIGTTSNGAFTATMVVVMSEAA